jgi:hypothetical protein
MSTLLEMNSGSTSHFARWLYRPSSTPEASNNNTGAGSGEEAIVNEIVDRTVQNEDSFIAEIVAGKRAP